ncbi:MAG: phosphoribosyltransferase family protein [Gammaproteobacteria bacterium]|nr:phosphoribosyltransferase family protein [Gammaproteobacteria bacterium]
MTNLPDNVYELRDLHNVAHVFRDREHAGEVLAGMLESYRGSNTLVLAIPAGGVPVAVALAKSLQLELDVIVTKKITLPWNSEFGYGAVAYDGTVHLNDALLPQLKLSKEEIKRDTETTIAKVRLRNKLFRGDLAFPDISGRSVILVDDGLATGITYYTAIQSLKKSGAAKIIGATPTGYEQSVIKIAGVLQEFHCANIRSGLRYAVADAYEKWHDVPEQQVIKALKDARYQTAN